MSRRARSQTAVLEARRREVQADLDAQKSAAERNRLGQFATPNGLAIDIARYAASLATGPVWFADPSVGTGSFYSAARVALGPARIKSAIGVELDPVFVRAARDVWREAGLEVIHGDFTRIVVGRVPPVRPNLVLANPPYVRHHHLERGEKERLRQIVSRMTGVEVNGLAGLYVYFLLLATAWMADDGVAAWLVPSEFMDVNYGAALKRFLTERVNLVRVHRFAPDDVQFADALVSSAVVVFRKSRPAADHAVEFSYGGSIARPSARALVPVARLRHARKWTAFPHHAGNDRHTVSDGACTTLGDLFRVRRGIATGANKFFILTRTEARARRFPERYLRPILPSPRHLRDTIVLGGTDGYPLVDPQLCVIDCDLAESALRMKAPALWAYLQSAEELGVMDGYLVGKRTPWYKQEHREPAPFLCTYMGRGSAAKRPFRFIWNRSAAIGTNLYLMLYPRGTLAAMLKAHPDRTERVYALLAGVTGNELRGEGRVYGGGLNKIEPSELARVSAAPFVETWPELRPETDRQGELLDRVS